METEKEVRGWVWLSPKRNKTFTADTRPIYFKNTSLEITKTEVIGSVTVEKENCYVSFESPFVVMYKEEPPHYRFYCKSPLGAIRKIRNQIYQDFLEWNKEMEMDKFVNRNKNF